MVKQEIINIVKSHPYFYKGMSEFCFDRYKATFGIFSTNEIHLGNKNEYKIEIHFTAADSGTLYISSKDYPEKAHVMVGLKDGSISIDWDNETGVYCNSLIEPNIINPAIAILLGIDYVCYTVLAEDIEHAKEQHPAYFWR